MVTTTTLVVIVVVVNDVVVVIIVVVDLLEAARLGVGTSMKPTPGALQAFGTPLFRLAVVYRRGIVVVTASLASAVATHARALPLVVSAVVHRGITPCVCYS